MDIRLLRGPVALMISHTPRIDDVALRSLTGYPLVILATTVDLRLATKL